MGREGFSKVLNQGLDLLNSLTSKQRFLYNPQKRLGMGDRG
jgi:hypothetical protein